MDKPSLNTLGRHLQSLRRERNWSLSKLAAAADIAKSNLSRLEQGNGNPTLDTLWRLAVQLNVPFATLVFPIKVPLAEAGVEVKLIDQGQDSPKVDAYWMSCAPNTKRLAEGHTPGSMESITVISGEVEVGVKGQSAKLRAGQSHVFSADQAHLYRTGKSWASLLITVTYPEVSDAT